MVSYSSEERLFSKGQTMSQAQYLNGYDDGYADAVKKIKASTGQGGGPSTVKSLLYVGDVVPDEVKDYATGVSADHDFSQSELPVVIMCGASSYMPIVDGDPGSSYSPGDIILLYGKSGTTPLAVSLTSIR